MGDVLPGAWNGCLEAAIGRYLTKKHSLPLIGRGLMLYMFREQADVAGCVC
jgi:hypothetical protein